MASQTKRNNLVKIKSDKVIISDQKTNILMKNKYPVARWKHAAVIYENYLYIMGGCSWTNTLRDLWRLNLITFDKAIAEQFKLIGIWNSIELIDKTINLWQNLSHFKGSIPALQSHTMIAYNNKLYIFGGAFIYDIKNCPFWIYDIENESMCKWQSLDKNVSVPFPRRNHSCSLYGNRMVIYGGFGDVKGSLGDLWSFDFISEKWHLMWSSQNNKFNKSDSQKLGPRNRHDHRAAIYKQYLLIFGGMSGLEMCNDLWQWNFDDSQWTKLIYKGDHEDLSYVIDVKVHNYWLLFGINDVKKKTEKWIYSFSRNKWITTMYHIPQFYPFSTLLNFSKDNDIYCGKIVKNKPKFNKIYPITDGANMSTLENSFTLNSCCINPYADRVKSSNYEKLFVIDSHSSSSVETTATNLSNMEDCETTFIDNSNGEEVSIEPYNKNVLIILGNNIDDASFDYHLNMQLLYL